MGRGSKFETDFQSLKEDGNKVEKAFAESCIEEYIFSTAEQDMNEHWDVMNPHTGIKFDVKGMKRQQRYSEPDENIHWVEIRNVNGDLGWLYGQADYIVFEIEEYWVVVEREKLKCWIETNIQPRPIHNKPVIDGIYQRKDRKDKIVLVKTIILVHLSSNFIRK